MFSAFLNAFFKRIHNNNTRYDPSEALLPHSFVIAKCFTSFLRIILLKFRNYFPAYSSQQEAAILKFKFGALSSEYLLRALASI